MFAAATEPSPPPAQSLWERFSARIGKLVEVRSVEPTPKAARPIDAAARLRAGDLAGAIAAIEAQPASPAREAWLQDARRLQAAERAVARLEADALQPPSAPAQLPVNAPEALAAPATEAFAAPAPLP
jgi:hypothetical protein